MTADSGSLCLENRAAAGAGAVALGASCLAMGGVIVKTIALPAVTLSCYRLWLGELILAAAICATRRRPRGRVIGFGALGGLCFAADNALFLAALKSSAVAAVVAIGSLQPIMLLLANRCLGVPASRREMGWVVVAVSGVVLLVIGSTRPRFTSATGQLLALGALGAWTAYWLVSKRARRDHDALEYTAVVVMVAAMVMTAVAAVAAKLSPPPHLGDWLLIAMLVGLADAGHVLVNWAHRFVSVSISSVAFTVGVPLVASVAAAVLLRERLSAVQALGAGLAVVAATAVALGPPRSCQPRQSVRTGLVRVDGVADGR